MKIGELAEATGCTVQAIRYYEEIQLLKPTQRSEGNYRLYDKSAMERLMFIKQCRSLELALSEIRVLLELIHCPGKKCDDVNLLVDSHIQQIDDRIEALTNLRQQLSSLRRRCSSNRTVERCGILQNLAGSANLL